MARTMTDLGQSAKEELASRASEALQEVTVMGFTNIWVIFLTLFPDPPVDALPVHNFPSHRLLPKDATLCHLMALKRSAP